MKQIPFAVVGGFLGAGKTTLINRFLAANDGVRYAVLVNDFGEINIDSHLIGQHDGQTIALSNGCICCSMVNGFVQTMVELMQRPERIDRVLVEASGVSEPRRIMDFAVIDPYLVPCHVAVMIDSVRFDAQRKDPLLQELVLRQVAQADILFLNKQDLSTPRQIEALVDVLGSLAGQIEIHVGQDGSMHPDLLFRTQEEGTEIQDKAAPAGLAFHSMKISPCEAIERDLFERFCAGLDTRVIRGKGLVRFADSPDQTWVWQRVGTGCNLSKVNGRDRGASTIVLIASDKSALPSADSVQHYFPSPDRG